MQLPLATVNVNTSIHNGYMAGTAQCSANLGATSRRFIGNHFSNGYFHIILSRWKYHYSNPRCLFFWKQRWLAPIITLALPRHAHGLLTIRGQSKRRVRIILFMIKPRANIDCQMDYQLVLHNILPEALHSIGNVLRWYANGAHYTIHVAVFIADTIINIFIMVAMTVITTDKFRTIFQ